MYIRIFGTLVPIRCNLIMWCDQSMRLFYMTYVFMVQGRAFTPNSHLAGYCCVGYCHFFYLTISVKRGQCPGLNSQVLRVLKILVAHQLNITAVFELKYILTIFSFFSIKCILLIHWCAWDPRPWSFFVIWNTSLLQCAPRRCEGGSWNRALTCFEASPRWGFHLWAHSYALGGWAGAVL